MNRMAKAFDLYFIRKVNDEVNSFNALAEKHSLKTRLSFNSETLELNLVTEEGLKEGKVYSNLTKGSPAETIGVISSLKKIICFELGE